MHTIIRLFTLGVILCLFSIVAFASNIPQPEGLVSDYTGKLTYVEKQNLQSQILSFQKNAQLVIALVPDMQGDEIGPYSNKMFNEWGIGSKGKDKGILLVVSLKERKVRFEVGYGMEGTFPDLKTQEIIQRIKPFLGQGKFYDAFSLAIKEVSVIAKKE